MMRVAAVAPARATGWARMLLFAGALLLLVAVVVSAAVHLANAAPAGVFAGLAPAMLLAGLLYFGGHFVRIARLALITGDARISLRDLAGVHLFTSGVSLALPFKLGDAYRAVELSALLGGAVRGITAVIVERLCDVAVILLLLLFTLGVESPDADAYEPVLAASLLFVLATLIVAVLLPDNLRRLGNYIIRRYSGEWTVSALRRIAGVRTVIGDAGAMLNGRYASLLAFSLLIWLLEAASLAVVFAAVPAGFQPFGTLLAFLSSITEGLTLPARLAAGVLDSASAAFGAYLAATQVPLAVVGLAAGVSLMAHRLRTPNPAVGRVRVPRRA